MSEAWGVGRAADLAREHVGALGDRWEHVRAVGIKAERVADACALSETVVIAAWLHDIGYGADVKRTGFHPLDGARFLADAGAPGAVVALVAFHSGADSEARERGLTSSLASFGRPSPEDLDDLTLLDMTTGPTGQAMAEVDRLAEILSRYSESHPVHRAVKRSAPGILAACRRSRDRLGLTDESRVLPL